MIVKIIFVMCLLLQACYDESTKELSTPKSRWADSSFMIESLIKAKEAGVTPFRAGDIESLKIYLSSPSPEKRKTGLRLLGLDARFGVDDPQKCVDVIINHIVKEDSFDVIKWGLSALSTAVSSSFGASRVDTRLIAGRERFINIVNKHPEIIYEMFVLFEKLNDPLFEDTAIKELEKKNYSDTARIAINYLSSIADKSKQTVSIIDERIKILLLSPPEDSLFYKNSTYGDGPTQNDLWFGTLLDFFVDYGEPGISYLMKYIEMDVPDSIKHRVISYLGRLEKQIGRPDKSPALLIEVLKYSKNGHIIYGVIQLCVDFKLIESIPYLKKFLAEGQSLKWNELNVGGKIDIADSAARALERLGYRIKWPEKRPGYHKILYEPPEYKDLK